MSMYVVNDVLARLGVALLIGGSMAVFLPAAFALMGAGAWLLLISSAMSRA